VERTSAIPARLALVAIVALSGCAGWGSATPSSTPDSTARATPAASASPTTRADLQAILDHRRETYGAPGAIAAIEVGDERSILVSGDADDAGTPLKPADRFRIASITKPIVAALVLDAVAKEELSLDDVVATHLPGLVRAEPPITIRQVLDHTSGVFDEGNEGDLVADIDRLQDPLQREARDVLKRWTAGERVIAPDRVFVALAETHERYSQPGLEYHYSNPNYQIAAMILEKVTGQSLADLLESRIAKPLGLMRTTVAPPDTSSPEMRGYERNPDGALRDMTDDLVAFGNGGNGGIVSTPNELLTVMQAIVSGRFLPEDLVTEMKTPTIGSYGLGLASYDFTCGKFYGHEGLVNGTRSVAVVNDDRSAGVVIALNLHTENEPGLPMVAERMICPSLQGG
jgi:D-alanyl-D-alanine carboxypeptidase